MKTLRILPFVLFALLFSCENENAPEPQFEEVFRKTDIDKDPNLSGLIDHLGRSTGASARTSSSNVFNTEMGELQLDQIIERIKDEEQPGPNYTIALIPPSEFENSIEWLVLVAKSNGYVGYILQLEPSAQATFENYSGYIRTLDLERTVQSEKYYVNGNETDPPSNLRLDEKYTNCVCEYLIETSEEISTATGLPLPDGVGSYSITIVCNCTSGGGGSSSGGGESTGGIGDPIDYPIDGNETGSGSGDGSGGGDGSSDSDGIEAGGGTGETIGLKDRLPKCGEGETWNGETCVNELAERLNVLEQFLSENPDALIDLPCEELEKWQEISTYSPPEQVFDKIQNLNTAFTDFYGDYDILLLQEANGVTVNMDYFPVTISELPDGMTASMLLDHIRKNINNFVNTKYSRFSAVDEVITGFDEQEIWLSNDPIGAIIHIEISGDDGSVICSDYSSNQWKFTTIHAPLDHDHPVSGTREFGYKDNPDGSYTFYTRGVDRFTQLITGEFPAYVFTLGSPFSGADALWKSFQDKITNYVNQSGGSATKHDPIIGRPKWSEVEKFLNGEISINDIDCE